MKKLQLNVEELAVEQFATAAADERKQGYEASKEWSGCNIFTCYC
ncbi:hypothetical protein [Longimicrobium sp.]|nr:hypothetical protein [Longimicrobium sp.]HEX6039308.1 hypothetical protein [Longimicrobium sp.]